MGRRIGAVVAVLVSGGATALGILALGQPFDRDSQPSSLAAPPARAVTLRTVFDADLETTTGSLWSAPQVGEDGRLTLVRAVEGKPIRAGSVAARFEVRSGDSAVAGSGEGERAEVFLDERRTGASAGRQWWAWSTYFPQDFDAPSGDWNVFTQFHGSSADTQANIHFDVRDKTSIGLRVMGGSASTPTRRDFTLAPLERGRWYDFVFHVGWSAQGDGFVEVYVDGALVVPKVHTPTLYEGQSVYVKQGYYRAPYDGTTVVFHDGLRRLAPAEASSVPAGAVTLPQ